jgi:hypothetical protein
VPCLFGAEREMKMKMKIKIKIKINLIWMYGGEYY